jgi:acetyltransferase-like isoleucine patch superfamily enzyme
MPLRHRLVRLAFALPGSLLFCLRHLPLREALRLPILISHSTSRTRNGGTVRVQGPLRPGMVKIGFGFAPLFDWRRERGVWDVPGEVVFEGPAEISHGVKLSIEGRLVVGRDVFVNARTRILCEREIVLGADSKLSWDVLVMDTDSHSISDREPAAAIAIGQHALIGAQATILKGTTIPDGAIVAASSCVTRSCEIAPHELVAGNPARVIRSGVSWQR